MDKSYLLNLPEELHTRIKIAAAKDGGRSMKDFIIRAVEEAVSQVEAVKDGAS